MQLGMMGTIKKKKENKTKFEWCVICKYDKRKENGKGMKGEHK